MSTLATPSGDWVTESADILTELDERRGKSAGLACLGESSAPSGGAESAGALGGLGVGGAGPLGLNVPDGTWEVGVPGEPKLLGDVGMSGNEPEIRLSPVDGLSPGGGGLSPGGFLGIMGGFSPVDGLSPTAGLSPGDPSPRGALFPAGGFSPQGSLSPDPRAASAASFLTSGTGSPDTGYT